MKINIVAVGKIKEGYIRKGIAEFLKRLRPYARVKIIEVSDEKIPPRASGAEIEIVKEKEGKKILSKLPDGSYTIVLDRKGKSLSSEGLAKSLHNLQVKGRSQVTFVIGGAMGLHKDVLEKADFILSFSHMTFTHQMIRLILLEQIYRAFKILRKEPYHY